ncbi:hypothetical protein BJF78_28840 [Pseudonocardia sp. CNS-139]|nr:hypothetical protein BJF78_28840 [Pseudonocardia sp. CNS-139]
MEYRGGVTADWAAAVIRAVHRRSLDLPPPTIDETWLDVELVLYVRYRLGRKKLAARFRLDVDPASGGPPLDADGLAANLFHGLAAGAATGSSTGTATAGGATPRRTRTGRAPCTASGS